MVYCSSFLIYLWLFVSALRLQVTRKYAHRAHFSQAVNEKITCSRCVPGSNGTVPAMVAKKLKMPCKNTPIFYIHQILPQKNALQNVFGKSLNRF
jgi:hypothetical protein